jgi:hypothetical protein
MGGLSRNQHEHPDFVRPSRVFRGYFEFLQSRNLVRYASRAAPSGKPFRDTWWEVSEQVLARR